MKKQILILVLLSISTVVLSQAVEKKTAEHVPPQNTESKIDTVSVPLTEWQISQLNAFEQQRKIVEDQSRLLLMTILDANGIKENEIQNVGLDKSSIVVIRKRKPKK